MPTASSPVKANSAAVEPVLLQLSFKWSLLQRRPFNISPASVTPDLGSACHVGQWLCEDVHQQSDFGEIHLNVVLSEVLSG